MKCSHQIGQATCSREAVMGWQVCFRHADKNDVAEAAQQLFEWSITTRGTIDELSNEKTRLSGLVKKAYLEGFENGAISADRMSMSAEGSWIGCRAWCELNGEPDAIDLSDEVEEDGDVEG